MIPLLISLIALFLTVILYQKRIGQLFLRFLVIVSSYLLIINFSLKVRKPPTPPVLLVDCSPSMKRYLTEINAAIESLHFDFQKILFSDTTYFEEGDHEGRFTNISNALITARNFSPSLIILVSDGNHNFGSPPTDILNGFTIPIYCFGMGNKEIKDQKIVNVSHPDYSFRQDTVLIEVTVETSGFSNEAGRILLRGEKLFLEKTFRLSRNLTLQTILFKFVPLEYGEQKYKIVLLPQKEEINTNNNEASFAISIFERKVAILYYTDHPSFNTIFITNYLKKNPDFDLSEFICLSEKKYDTRGKVGSHEQLNLGEFDIVVLDNINAQTIDQDIKNLLRDGKSILVAGTIRGTSDLLHEILPFRTSGTALEQELPVRVLLPFAGLSPENDYAPVSKINRVIGVNPQTTIIAQAGDLPLIGYRRLNNCVIFQINMPDLGLWHFAQLNLNNQDILNPLLHGALRFLSPYGRSQRLILSSPIHQYQTGERISLYLKAYDQRLIPASGGDFYLEMNNRSIPFYEIGRGRYEATFYAESSGTFSAVAKGVHQNDTLKSTPIIININKVDSESEEAINDQLLDEIARRTGGRYVDFSQLVHFKPPISVISYETKIFSFDQPLIYALIFCLLVLEWIIRKKRGEV